jgi:hypothetical protein
MTVGRPARVEDFGIRLLDAAVHSWVTICCDVPRVQDAALRNFELTQDNVLQNEKRLDRKRGPESQDLLDCAIQRLTVCQLVADLFEIAELGQKGECIRKARAGRVGSGGHKAHDVAKHLAVCEHALLPGRYQDIEELIAWPCQPFGNLCG